MTRSVPLGCHPNIEVLPLDKILPVKHLAPGTKQSTKYMTIAASVREIGIIEPLIVFPMEDQPGVYMLLDGHVRHQVCSDSGIAQVECLIALDDEAYTYNHRVNRLSAIQEHFMITRAIDRGVPEQRIAKCLDIDLYNVRRKRDLLDGICPEAVELLKHKSIGGASIREMRKVKPLRQIEIAELMISSSNFSKSYARCLLAATSQEQLIEEEKEKEVQGLSPDDIARIEREMAVLEGDYRSIEENHGKNVLNLVIVVGYLKKLLDNSRVVRFLSRNHPEILTEFQNVVEARQLQ